MEQVSTVLAPLPFFPTSGTLLRPHTHCKGIYRKDISQAKLEDMGVAVL